ncbi:hypothetical protein [Streptomyces hygroscopicus]|uniref:hypothetical protein n=1 Tax=Streptomyces hygroscopicus TaxID=1912 RepID=UPI00223FC993|nr:hypothetical protein [Streptomyces hygroscopicus]
MTTDGTVRVTGQVSIDRSQFWVQDCDPWPDAVKEPADSLEVDVEHPVAVGYGRAYFLSNAQDHECTISLELCPLPPMYLDDQWAELGSWHFRTRDGDIRVYTISGPDGPRLQLSEDSCYTLHAFRKGGETARARFDAARSTGVIPGDLEEYLIAFTPL